MNNAKQKHLGNLFFCYCIKNVFIDMTDNTEQ